MNGKVGKIFFIWLWFWKIRRRTIEQIASVEFRNRDGVMFCEWCLKNTYIITFAPIFNLETYKPSSLSSSSFGLLFSLFLLFPHQLLCECMNELRKKGHTKRTLDHSMMSYSLLIIIYYYMRTYAVCADSALLSALYLYVNLCVLNFWLLCKFLLYYWFFHASKWRFCVQNRMNDTKICIQKRNRPKS